MTIQIVFQVNPDALPSTGGTFNAPMGGVGHPDMLVSRDGASSIKYGGDYPVQVYRQEQVQIWLEDVSRRTSIIMAPVRFLANTWKDDGSTVAKTFVVGTPTDPDTQIDVLGADKPLTLPDFMLTHANEYGFVYNDTQVAWNTDDNATFNQYFRGVMVGQDGTPEAPRIHSPYVTFAMSDEDGILNYGLEFVLIESGKSRGYFWFDPNLKVTQKPSS